MIKFFSKIRQNSIKDNKMIIYLKYAIGEIVLVVIGILIALSINSWNQDRVNKKNENKYLDDIKKELQGNIGLSNYYFNNNLTKKIEGLTLAKKYCEQKIQDQDTLDFLNKVSYGAVMSTGITFFSTKSYDELINTGNFQLITHDSLKNEVKNYYWSLEASIEDLNNKTSGYAKFLNELKPFDFSNPSYISYYDQKEMMIALNSAEFRKLVDLELTFANNIKSKSEELNEKGLKLISSIEDALKNK